MATPGAEDAFDKLITVGWCSAAAVEAEAMTQLVERQVKAKTKQTDRWKWIGGWGPAQDGVQRMHLMGWWQAGDLLWR